MKWPLFILISMVLLLQGCGNRQDAPDYANQTALILMDVCDDITASRDAEALRKLKQLQGHEDFVEEATLAIRRRMNAKKATAYLKAGDLEQLNEFFEGQAHAGWADTKSLQNQEIPEALMALTLFKARMPWEDATVLENELAKLALHNAVLEQSPAFLAFRKKQYATLKNLQRQRSAEQERTFFKQTELALLRGDNHAYLVQEAIFRKQQPNNPYFYWSKQFFDAKVPRLGPKANLNLYALALASQWKRLPTPLRKEALLPLSNAPCMSAQLCHTRLTRSYLPFLLEAKKRDTVIGGDILQEALQCMPCSPKASGKELSPCPNPIDFFRILQEL